jgi:hypothetical protein
MRNRHPADALADIRVELANLKAEHERLRRELIAADPESRIGDDYAAEVVTTNTHVDRKALEKHFGRSAIEPFATHIRTDTVKLYLRQKGRNRANT